MSSGKRWRVEFDLEGDELAGTFTAHLDGYVVDRDMPAAYQVAQATQRMRRLLRPAATIESVRVHMQCRSCGWDSDVHPSEPLRCDCDRE